MDYEPSPLTAEVQIRIAGLSRLSAVNQDRERKKRQWLIAVEGGAGIEPAISHVLRVCLPKAPTAHFEGGAGLPRYAPAPGIVRT